MALFDRKFGKEFIQSIPNEAGVYTFSAEDGRTLYVGKAKNLRRRLAQYRRARGGKMRKIVKAAASLRFEICPNELDACLLELREIQKEKPKLNIAGAFSFRYPLIGYRVEKTDFFLCFTTTPEVFTEYRFYGAYRSRFITAEAFFSLVRLLRFIGHPIKLQSEKKAYTYEYGLRRLPVSWPDFLHGFLNGTSAEFLEQLFLKLLENAGARAKSSDIQEGMDALKAFWEQECEPLARAIAIVGFPTYPVPQTERDPLFVRAGFEKKRTLHDVAPPLEPFE
jgi:excinuclease ABC subunit C